MRKKLFMALFLLTLLLISTAIMAKAVTVCALLRVPVDPSYWT
jgi:hypothetical protein